MAVAFDTSANVEDFGVTTVTTPSFTVANVANRAIAVHLGTLVAISAVTVTGAGQSCSAVSGAAGNDGASSFLAWYRAVAPNTGSQTASASWTTASSVSLSAVVANGVDQTTPVNGGGYAQSASPVSLAISSNSGDLTFTSTGNGLASNASTSNQTKFITSFFSVDRGSGGAGPITHTWTLSGTMNVAGANFVQVASSGSSDVKRSVSGRPGNKRGPRRFVAKQYDLTPYSYPNLFTTEGAAAVRTPGPHRGPPGRKFQARRYAITDPVVAVNVTGTIASTLDDVGMSAVGIVDNRGSFASTLGGVTMVAAGQVTNVGAFASTLDGMTMAASGLVDNRGTFASTLDGVTMNFSGSVAGAGISGAFASTLDGVVMAASGQVSVPGAFASTLAGVTMAANGQVGINVTGTIGSTLGDVTMGAAGFVGTPPAGGVVFTRRPRNPRHHLSS